MTVQQALQIMNLVKLKVIKITDPQAIEAIRVLKAAAFKYE